MYGLHRQKYDIINVQLNYFMYKLDTWTLFKVYIPKHMCCTNPYMYSIT